MNPDPEQVCDAVTWAKDNATTPMVLWRERFSQVVPSSCPLCVQQPPPPLHTEQTETGTRWVGGGGAVWFEVLNGTGSGVRLASVGDGGDQRLDNTLPRHRGGVNGVNAAFATCIPGWRAQRHT